jgi:hypothetical protein
MICNTCKADKAETEFNKANKTTRGYSYICRACTREYNLLRREDAHKRWHEWYYNNNGKEISKESKYLYFKNNRQATIAHTHRSELNHCLNQSHPNRTYKTILSITGCDTRQALIAHLDSTAPSGMTFKDNYGKRGILEIDHIKPCSAFDLTKPEQLKECFHKSNLRLVTHFINQSKGSQGETPNSTIISNQL